MAKIPSQYDSQRAVPQFADKAVPDMRVNPVDVTGFYRERARAGAQIREVGEQVADEQARDRLRLKEETDRLDNLRVEEAMNRLRDRQVDLTYSEKDGYANIKGSAAVNRKTPLLDDYNGRYDNAINEVSNTLTTDSQKEKFLARAGATAVSFKADLMRHMVSQGDEYKKEVAEGSLETESRQAALNWHSPTELDKSKMRIGQIIDDAFADSPDEFKAAKKLHSMTRINSSVVANQIASGQYAVAKEYIKNNVSSMDVSDVIRYNADILKAETAITITSAVDKVISKMREHFTPNGSDLLLSLVAQAESGNRDYGEDGKPITSPRGAVGRMQVLPATAKNPGFGITPAKDDSLDEYARVGREFLNAMLIKYGGDVPKALAAYNYGPGNLAMAEEKAAKSGAHWINHVPDETKGYVQKIMAKFMAGDNPINKPTLADIKNNVAAELSGQPRSVIDQAMIKAEQQYNDQMAVINQESDNALLKVMQKVDSGELTSYNDIPPSDMLALGGKRVSARSYIDAATARAEKDIEKSAVATDFYYTMLTDPVKLKNTPISDIIDLTPQLGRERVNSLLSKRTTYVNQPDSEKAASVDSDQFRAMAIKFGYNLSKKKDKEELALIKEETEYTINKMQNENGKTLSRDDKEKVIKNMMVEFPKVKARYKGGLLSGRETTMSVRGYELHRPENIIVPDDLRNQIVRAFAAAPGGRKPTEREIREIYVEKLASEQTGR